MKKKILLCVSTMELGGAEKQAISLASYLINKGYYVSILGFNSVGKVVDLCIEKGIPCVKLDPASPIIRILIKIANLALKRKRVILSAQSYKLAKYIERNLYDVCISYCSPANITLGLSKLFYKKSKNIWYQRDAGLSGKVDTLEKIALSNTDIVLANSESGKKWLETAYDVEATVIENGVCLAKPLLSKKEWRNRMGASDKDIIYVMVANLCSAKNHIVLLKAWNYLRNKGMIDHKILAFAGRYDDQYENLSEYIEKNELTNNVCLLGPVDDVSGLLHSCDVCIYGAKSEGSPNGIIEAELAGLPVLASDLDEIRDIVPESSWLYLFENSNDEQIARLVNGMYDSSDLRKKLGEQNKEYVTRRFSQAKNFNGIIEIIEGR